MGVYSCMNKAMTREELLEKEVSRQAQVIADKEHRITLLEQKIDLLARKLFGKSSEQLDDAQMQLLLEGIDEPKKPESDGLDEQEAKPSPKPPRKRKSRKETLPADLPTEEVVLLPIEVEASPELYREVGEEVTEKLDYHPAQFTRVITRRKKFVKKLVSLEDPEADRFYLAPLPPSLKEKSLLTPRLAAEIATNRYCYHLPYYRQEQMFLTRHGVHLPRNTMSQWMGDLAHDYLSGIYEAMHDELLQAPYLQVDETPIEYLDPHHGKAKQGYLWVASTPDLNAVDGRGDIFFQWHTGRATECLKGLLRSKNHCFIGTLQSDGYLAYDRYNTDIKGLLTQVRCLAHVRRKFYEARNHKPKIIFWILKQLQNLYAIEARLREGRASPAERERVRRLESLPIYYRLQKAFTILTIKRKILPQSTFGKALSYALAQWDMLEECFKDGRLEVDNNLIENGIRPTKLGAKNWLFMGSETAGQTNAIWYTLIESCRRRKVDPWKYLVWLFEELPTVKVQKDTFAKYTPRAYTEKNSLIRSLQPQAA